MLASSLSGGLIYYDSRKSRVHELSMVRQIVGKDFCLFSEPGVQASSWLCNTQSMKVTAQCLSFPICGVKHTCLPAPAPASCGAALLKVDAVDLGHRNHLKWLLNKYFWIAPTPTWFYFPQWKYTFWVRDAYTPVSSKEYAKLLIQGHFPKLLC